MEESSDSDSMSDEVASKSLEDLFRRYPTRQELVNVMEGYSVQSLLELPERKVIGILDGLLNSEGLAFLDYSCILKAVWSEKKYLHVGKLASTTTAPTLNWCCNSYKASKCSLSPCVLQNVFGDFGP